MKNKTNEYSVYLSGEIVIVLLDGFKTSTTSQQQIFKSLWFFVCGCRNKGNLFSTWKYCSSQRGDTDLMLNYQIYGK